MLIIIKNEHKHKKLNLFQALYDKLPLGNVSLPRAYLIWNYNKMKHNNKSYNHYQTKEQTANNAGLICKQSILAEK